MTSIPSLTPGDTVAVTFEAEFRHDAESLGMFYIEHVGRTHGIPREVITSVAVIEPPKPAEPLGLGAVVEDSEGELWIKIDRHADCNDWARLGAPEHADAEQATGRTVRWFYRDIDAVKVLSKGVEVA